MTRLARSFLYVPADNLERLLRSNSRRADAVIADLEDSQTSDSRPAALSNVEELLRIENFGPQVWVRVFPDEIDTQVPRLASHNLSGIVLPEVSLNSMVNLDAALAKIESQLGLSEGNTPVIGLIESASALRDIHRIAEHPRIRRLGMGEADLCGDIGISGNNRELVLLPLRLQVAVASAAAGIQAPIGSTSTNYTDPEALRQSTIHLYELGFRARTAIHPRQVDIINTVFTPSDEEVESANKIIALLEAAQASGRGAIADSDGNMIDAAVVRTAREVLARAAEH